MWDRQTRAKFRFNFFSPAKKGKNQTFLTTLQLKSKERNPNSNCVAEAKPELSLKLNYLQTIVPSITAVFYC